MSEWTDILSRRRGGKSLREVAAEAGVDPSTVMRLERAPAGGARPLAKLVVALKLSQPEKLRLWDLLVEEEP